MRKITSLLALFLVCFGITASAQEVKPQVIKQIGEPITNVTDLDPNANYVIRAVVTQDYLAPDANSKLKFVAANVEDPTTVVWKINKNTNDTYAFTSYDNSKLSIAAEAKTGITASEFEVLESLAGKYNVRYNQENKYWFNNNGTLIWKKSNNGPWKPGKPTKPTTNSGNFQFEICPVTIGDKAALTTVTYIYQYNGKEIKRLEDKKAPAGGVPAVPGEDYVTFAYDKATIPAEGGEIIVTCTVNLPFEATTDLTAAKWYNVQMHDKYYWKYDGSVVTANIPTADEILNVDAYSWCFMGDLWNGFKIYNKADVNKALYAPVPEVKDQDGKVTELIKKAVLGDVATAAQWKLYVSDYNKEMTCFSVNGVDFLNNAQQTKDVNGQPTNDDNFYLFYSLKKGNGSSCKFIPLSGEAAKVNALIESWRKVEKYVGGIADKTVLDKAAKAATVAGAQTILEAAAKNQIDEKEFYRLINVKNNKFLSVKDGCLISDVSNDGDAMQFWMLSKGAAKGQYKLQSPNYNQYVQTPGTNALTADVVDLDITDHGIAQFSLSSKSSYLALQDDGTITSFNDANGEETHWYLAPVKQIHVNLVSVGNADSKGEDLVTTIYLPFEAQHFYKSGCEYYMASAQGNSLTLKAVDGVHANQGTILKIHDKPEKGSFYLKIGKNVARPLATLPADFTNAISGTNTPLPVTDAASVYVLGVHSTMGLGFYHPSDKLTTLAANKAFIKKESVPTGVNGFRLDFGDLTGIGKVVASQPEVQSQVIYDLSGRRVNKMTKGIYIVNGKKMMVK